MPSNNDTGLRIALNPTYLNKIEKIRKLKPEYTNKDGTPNKKRVVETALDIYFNFLLKIAVREDKVFNNRKYFKKNKVLR